MSRRRERTRPTERTAATPARERHPAPAVPRPSRRTLPALLAGGVALLALGIAVGAYWFGGDAEQLCAERFAHLNPRIACGPGPAISKRSYDPFRAKLAAALAERVRTGDARSVSVYFRDLAYGPVFGIDENAQFVPASLLKLPLVLAFLDLAEDDPALLDRTLPYDGDAPVPAENVRPAVTLRRGEAYPIRTLLENVIRHSDNASYLLLRSYQRSLPDGDGLLLRAYRELGIVNPADALDQTVSVRGYAALFRLLYNASYLSPEMSELALSWLAASEFRDGIVAGVPSGTVVAHKFGERSMTETEMPSGPRQLHDCGIVYYPRNPYLLCVMTRGMDFAPLTDVVRSVSAMVHQEVASRAIPQDR